MHKSVHRLVLKMATNARDCMPQCDKFVGIGTLFSYGASREALEA